jgi:hypothetical protein
MTSETASELVFPRVKRKFFVGLVVSASLLCAAVALCFVETNRQLQIVEIIGACLCAFYGAYCVWEIRDPTPGLVIDREGIVDNLGSNPHGRIPWSEITGFRMFDFLGTPYVMVDLVDHQKFIGKRGWQRSSAKLASDVAGSPLGFTGESIGLTPEELFRVFSDAREKFGAAPAEKNELGERS